VHLFNFEVFTVLTRLTVGIGANIFWAEKLVLVIIQQFLPRNVKINKIQWYWSDESVKNYHFTRISGSDAARHEIFEHILS
jgi:hypothetical protein